MIAFVTVTVRTFIALAVIRTGKTRNLEVLGTLGLLRFNGESISMKNKCFVK